MILKNDFELDGAVAKLELVRTAAFFAWGKRLFHELARTEMVNVAGKAFV